MTVTTVERTYLQMLAPPPLEELRASTALPEGVRIVEEEHCSVPLYRQLYGQVGERYYWRDRLQWSDDELAAYLARPDVRLWVLRDAEGIGGYFELVRGADRGVEIAYFGLVPSRHGRGLGKALLSRAIVEGWGWEAARLWLHTCTLDGPAALPNYRARGFVPFKRETYEVTLGDR